MNKILITGASGFLGKEICVFFNKENINYTTLGRAKSNDLIFDLSKEKPNLEGFFFDTVIHVAGKAHSVPKSEEERQEFYNVNVNGTKNLLNSLDDKIKTIIFISTIAVYGLDKGLNITEDYPLKGSSPYAKSKIEAEKEMLIYGVEKGINIVILRLPLITGKDPIGNLKMMIDGIKKGFYFRIGKGLAKRSLIASSDIGPLVLKLKGKKGVFNIADSSYPMIKEIDLFIGGLHNKRIKVLPDFAVKLLAKIGDLFSFFPFNTVKYQKLTNSLTFSNEKILKEVDWVPSYCLNDLKENI